MLYEADELNNKQPFYARTMINEGLSFRGVVYTDSLGFTYYARIMYDSLGYTSYDGDLYLDYFTPPFTTTDNNRMEVSYAGEDLEKDKSNPQINVLEFDDGGNEIVKIVPDTYVKDFKFISIKYDENGDPTVDKVLYEADVLNRKQPFYAKTMINEGLSFRGVVYTDSFGFTVYARIMFNSKYGWLYLETFASSGGVNNQPSQALPAGDWYDEVVLNGSDVALLLNLKSDNSVRYDCGYAYSEILSTYVGTWKTEGNVLTLTMANNAEENGASADYVFEWDNTENGISLKHIGGENLLSGLTNATFSFIPKDELSHSGTAPVYSTSKMVITTNTSNAEFTKRATAITGSRMYFRFDTAEEFKSFKADFADVLNFDKGWGECKSFNEEMAEYTDKFFEDNTLVLVYFISDSESYRYSIEGVIKNGKTLRVTISQINNPDIYNMMQVAWFGVLAFPDDEIASCTEYKSNLGSFEYQPDAEAITTAYANWSENSLVYTEALNKGMISVGNSNGLPMYRIDNEADEEAFKKTFENVFEFDSSYDEVGTVNAMLKRYDNKFYENSSLILVYVTASSGSYRYSIDKIMIKDNNFFVCVKKTVNPELITDNMVGWLIAVQVNDSFLDNSNEFNAIMTQA